MTQSEWNSSNLLPHIPGTHHFSDPGEEGEGLTMATPNWEQLDEMGKMTSESQDTCVTLSEQIKAAMTEVSSKLPVFLCWIIAG